MGNIKNLYKKTTQYVSIKKNLLFLVILIAPIINRTLELITFLAALYIVFFVYYLLVNFKDNKKILSSIYVTAGIIFFSFLYKAYNHPRIDSWDGNLWYLKHIILLSKDFYLDIVNTAHAPYPVELFLAFIYRYTDIQFTVFFTVAMYFINAFLIYKLFIRYKLSKKQSLVVTFITITAPYYLALSFVEIKIEPFLMFCFLLSVFAYYNYADNPSYKNSFLFGLISGITILVKIITAPFFVSLYAVHLLFSKKLYYGKYALSLLVLASVVLLWIYRFGIFVPWTTINYAPKFRPLSQYFEADADAYKACLKDLKYTDFHQFFSDGDRYYLVPQIFKFIKNTIDPYPFSPSQVGNLLYFSLLLFLPLLLNDPKCRRDPIFISSGIFILYFYIYLRSVYWYLLIIFPFSIYMAYRYFTDVTQGKKFNELVLISYGLAFVLLLFSLLSSKESAIKHKIRTMAGTEYVFSQYLNSTEGLIFDATPFPNQVFLTYLGDYDKRVIRDSLYFGYTQKSDEEIYLELKEKGISYITFQHDNPKRGQLIFYGCTKTAIERALNFFDKYAFPIKYNVYDGSVIYKLM